MPGRVRCPPGQVGLPVEHQDRGQEVFGQVGEFVGTVGEDPVEHDLVDAADDGFRSDRGPWEVGDEFADVVLDDLGEAASPGFAGLGHGADGEDFHDARARELGLIGQELQVGADASAQPLHYGRFFEIGALGMRDQLVQQGIVSGQERVFFV